MERFDLDDTFRRIDGAPNFRRVPLRLFAGCNGEEGYFPVNGERMVCGRCVHVSFVSATICSCLTLSQKWHADRSRVSERSASKRERLTQRWHHRLRRALMRVDAGPGGKGRVFWTSLREVSRVYLFDSCSVLMSTSFLGASSVRRGSSPRPSSRG